MQKLSLAVLAAVAILLVGALGSPHRAGAAANGAIAGHLTGPDGTPLAGTYVFAEAVVNNNHYTVTTDSNGNYSVPLPAGSYLLNFKPPCPTPYNLAPAWYPGVFSDLSAQKVGVTAGQTTSVRTVAFVPSATITGMLLDAQTGGPVSSAEMSVAALSGMNGGVGEGFLSGDTYTINCLPPGSYTVEFIPNAGTVNGIQQSPFYADEWYPNQPHQSQAQVISLAPGQSVKLGVELAQAGGTVSGVVTSQHGRPLVGYWLGAGYTGPDGQFSVSFDDWPVTVSAAGTYSMPDMAPGTWTIALFPHGGGVPPLQTRTVTVSAGQDTPNVNFTQCVGAKCPTTLLGSPPRFARVC